MKYFVLLGLVCTGLAHAAPLSNQGIFSGPVNLRVWKSWMDSWNVEEIRPVSYQFELTRGYTSDGKPDLTLKYESGLSGLKAGIKCSAHLRSGEWEVKDVAEKELTAIGKAGSHFKTFRFDAPESCYDQDDQRVVTSIDIRISSQNKTVFETRLLPMYMRGKGRFYWANKFDAYSAHAGSGTIQVETAMAAERGGWDTWNGILVKPTLSYVERNSLSAGTEIGLHRHEKNQDVFSMESGDATVLMGTAHRSGKTYLTKRKWPGEVQANHETEEYLASGGWIEKRPFAPGQIAVIVPNPGRPDEIYFHGLDANTETVFWTMGTKN